LPDVKTLFAMPIAGKKPGEPKNSLFLSLIPGESNKPLVADAPDGVDPTDTVLPGGTDAANQGNAQAGGCSTSSGSSSASAAALLALGLLLAARRRKEG
jgi:MYXO-CTERM domain-containing protein